MKKLILIFSMGLLMLLPVSSPVSAHVLKADNGVSAVLHIKPDDNPKAGQDTVFSFNFSGSQAFAVQSCNCQVEVLRANTSILTSRVSGSGTEGEATLRLPEAGVYDIVISGNKPAFKLDFPVRVEADQTAGPNQQEASFEVVVISLASLITLVIVAAAQINRGKRYTKHN